MGFLLDGRFGVYLNCDMKGQSRMSDTPIVDKVIIKSKHLSDGSWTDNCVPIEAARQLERMCAELAAALKGTLYLFEQHAVSKAHIEQIRFSEFAIIKYQSMKEQK